jgi:hypothetical protein
MTKNKKINAKSINFSITFSIIAAEQKHHYSVLLNGLKLQLFFFFNRHSPPLFFVVDLCVCVLFLMNRFLLQVFRQPHTRPTRPVEVTRATLVSDYRTQQVIPWPVYTITTTRCLCCRTPSTTWGCTAARRQPPACMPCPCERERVADVPMLPQLLTKLDVLY